MMLTHQWLTEFKSIELEHDFNKDGITKLIDLAVQFDICDVDKIPRGKNADIFLSRPPFKTTLVQFDITGSLADKAFVLWHELDDGRSYVFAGSKHINDKRWHFSIPFFYQLTGDGRIELDIAIPEDTPDEEVKEVRLQLSWFIGVAKNFFYVLGCSNVITETNPAPQALNKKRAKAGKLPIFEYKTLHINVPGVRVEGRPLGGTHASPRVHLRRGHVRNLDNGKRVWVQACVVGSQHGMIHKDYKIKTYTQGARA